MIGPLASLATLAPTTAAPLLAAAGASPANALGWRPFLTPLPVWDHWFWLMLPLCAGVALVYKATKTADEQDIVKESVPLTLWIVLGLIGAAAAIAVVVRFT